MEKYDTRIDAYIEKSAEFAKPILIHIRQVAHEASEEICETIKWGFPHFDHQGTVCFMSSFKEHCAFGFWKSSLLRDAQGILQKEAGEAMGQFGKIKSISDLPQDDVLIDYIREAIILNKEGKKVPKKEAAKQSVPETPSYLLDALNKHLQAKLVFENFSNSHRKEYIMWLEEAKTEATRKKRLETALDWIAEGKGRNWKYERKG
jgi:uncharacterized protein YdeI (YjbR/CyaY-like superfamily)